eukprot:12807499-Ditylum_brightwellii.AAC.1
MEHRSSSGITSSSPSGWNKLDPEYQAMKDSMFKTIKVDIETKSLIAPLSYFEEEYFATLNDATRPVSLPVQHITQPSQTMPKAKETTDEGAWIWNDAEQKRLVKKAHKTTQSSQTKYTLPMECQPVMFK